MGSCVSQFAEHCTKLLLTADSQQKALCFVVFIHSELFPKLIANKETVQFLKCRKKLSKDKHQYACPASAGGLIGVEWKSGVWTATVDTKVVWLQTKEAARVWPTSAAKVQRVLKDMEGDAKQQTVADESTMRLNAVSRLLVC